MRQSELLSRRDFRAIFVTADPFSPPLSLSSVVILLNSERERASAPFVLLLFQNLVVEPSSAPPPPPGSHRPRLRTDRSSLCCYTPCPILPDRANQMVRESGKGTERNVARPNSEIPTGMVKKVGPRLGDPVSRLPLATGRVHAH